jgi:multicomponent Na+:H+ antiporter subunit F
MSVVAALAYALLGGGALLALVRLARGPSLLDRVVATDTLLVVIACGLAVYAALERDPTVVPVLVVVSLLAFVGSVSVARYVGGMPLRSEGSEDVGQHDAQHDGKGAALPPAARTRAGRAADGRPGGAR